MCKTNVQVYNECQLKKKKAQVTKEKGEAADKRVKQKRKGDVEAKAPREEAKHGRSRVSGQSLLP